MRLARVSIAAVLGAALAMPVHAGDAAPQKADKPRPAAKKPPDKSAPAPAAPFDPALIAALQGGDRDAAARAAAQAGDSADAAAHDALLDALTTGLNPKVAAVAIAGLAKHAAPGDVPVLLVYAAHRNDDARAAAVAALGAYPDPRAKQRVVAALGDDVDQVRVAAGGAVARGKIREGVERLLALLDKGDAAAPAPLAALADADLAHAIAEHLGTAPAGTLAQTLGLILKRADFPDPARVQVVRAIAKIPGAEATAALTEYLESVPAKPPRPSRKEAEQVVEQRLAGGGQ